MNKSVPPRSSGPAAQRFYNLNSWVGVLLGLVLFISLFTGSLALFDQDLAAWEKKEAHLVEAGHAWPATPFVLFHFAPLEGSQLRFLIFLTGLISSFGIIRYTPRWLERRRLSLPVKNRYWGLKRLHLGVSLGLVLASSVSIAAGRFMAPSVTACFWLTWILFIVAAYWAPSRTQLTRFSLLTTGLVLIGMAGDDLTNSPRLLPAHLNIDLTLIILGGLLFIAGVATAQESPFRRSPRTRKTRHLAMT